MSFSTGASGYIGGTALVHLVKQHPEWTINALVRDEANASTLKKSFPNVNFVIGALDSRDVLVAESEKADVVLSMFKPCCNFIGLMLIQIDLASSDDKPAIQFYIEGLAKRPESTNRYLIHTSGTGVYSLIFLYASSI